MIKRISLMISSLLVLTPQLAFAISAEQKKLLVGGTYYFDYANSCEVLAPSGGGSIYVVGDSLTVGMRDSGQLEQKLTTKGWTVNGIQATSGDQLSDAIPKIQTDINSLKSSNKQTDTFLIALGTNKDAGFAEKINQAVTMIKTYSPTAKIFWVNAYTKAANYDDINSAISSQATTLGYSIIDWKTEATTNPTKYPFAGDNIHHTGEGYSAKADFIVNSLGTPITTQAGQTGPATATKNLEEFIDTYGQIAFNVGKQYGIPYEAILAQAALESNYGGSKLTTEANNFFGIKAGTGWNGPVWTGNTQEETSNGGSYQITDSFRVYASPEEGFRGYGDFIRSNSRYRNALNYPGDPYRYIVEIKNAGYATDNEYIQSNWQLITQVEQYIKTKGTFPPSSQVTPDVAPPGPVDTSSPGQSQQSSGGCPPTSSTTPVAGGSNKEMGQSMAAERGWTGEEWVCLEKLWDRESGWKETADNPKSTAYGIPQALLGDHKENIDKNYPGYYEGTVQKPTGGKPDVQIKWGLDYISGRYTTPCRAWSHSEGTGWY